MQQSEGLDLFSGFQKYLIALLKELELLWLMTGFFNSSKNIYIIHTITVKQNAAWIRHKIDICFCN